MAQVFFIFNLNKWTYNWSYVDHGIKILNAMECLFLFFIKSIREVVENICREGRILVIVNKHDIIN